MTRGSDTALRLSFSLRETAPPDAKQSALNEVYSAMLRHEGNLAATAEYLGVGRSTLNRWIAEHAYLQLSVDSARRGVTCTVQIRTGSRWVAATEPATYEASLGRAKSLSRSNDVRIVDARGQELKLLRSRRGDRT